MDEKKELSKGEKVLVLIDFIVLIFTILCVSLKKQLGISESIAWNMIILVIVVSFSLFIYGCISLTTSILFNNKKSVVEQKVSNKNTI